jgi:hypothetical protein
MRAGLSRNALVAIAHIDEARSLLQAVRLELEAGK